MNGTNVEWDMEPVAAGVAGQRYVFKVGRRDLIVAMTDVELGVAQMIPLRLRCFLQPHADQTLSDIESAFGTILPGQLEVAFSGSQELVQTPSDWHLFLPREDHSGVETVERILVQVAAQAAGWKSPGNGDVSRLHAVVCPLIEQQVDPTFICALEML